MLLDVTRLQNLLETNRIGRNFLYFKEIDSTNRYLLEHSAELSPHTVAFTDFQSKGRGRLKRTWVAPSGSSLLVSTLFKPNFPPFWLTMMAGLAAVEAVEKNAHVRARLKWPNDVMLQQPNGDWRKTAGILTEAQSDGETTIAVVGMGMNVNTVAEELPNAATPATSLRVSSGSITDREQLLADWLFALEHWVIGAKNDKSPHKAWSEHLINIGQRVTVSGAVRVDGVAESADEWGRLIVRDDKGITHAVSAGDVTLRPPTQP